MKAFVDGAKLELELEDGRRLPFFFADGNQIAPSGPLK
jgi:hypothetical protein